MSNLLQWWKRRKARRDVRAGLAPTPTGYPRVEYVTDKTNAGLVWVVENSVRIPVFRVFVMADGSEYCGGER